MAGDERVRLTQLSAKAGCAAKLEPGRLAELVAGLESTRDPRLVVGPETSDDAGAFQLDADRILLLTVDVIAPIVDDPATFGAIAATNAISDVYAMGGEPLTALNVMGYPLARLPLEIGREILRGAAQKVLEAGAVTAGGHTTDDAELKFGVSVTGIVTPANLTPNSGARAGQLLVLTKSLGTGIISTAFKQDAIDESSAAYRAAVASMTTLNRAAAAAARTVGARGVTDVTGFGLGGHALEMALASHVSLEINLEKVPLLPDVLELAAGGYVTGGGRKGAAYYARHSVVPEAWQALVFDPQTSGGLLIAVDEAAADSLCAALPGAVVIGRVVEPTEPRLTARA